MKQPVIHLHIRELLLRNLPYGQRDQISSAVEHSLASLLRERGLPPALRHGGTIPCINLDHLQVAADATATEIGSHIAHSIYRSLLSPAPSPSPEGRSTLSGTSLDEARLL